MLNALSSLVLIAALWSALFLRSAFWVHLHTPPSGAPSRQLPPHSVTTINTQGSQPPASAPAHLGQCVQAAPKSKGNTTAKAVSNALQY